MDFGKALEAIKNGKKAKRKGWNGKGQYVVLAYMQECITSSGVSISEPEHINIGSKFLMFVGTSGYQCVTPYVGVWIEIINGKVDKTIYLSPPMWGCGSRQMHE